VITEPPSCDLSLDSIALTAVSVHGCNSGAISFRVHGTGCMNNWIISLVDTSGAVVNSISSFSYYGSNNHVFSNLFSMSYQLIVTDGNQCADTANDLVIEQPVDCS